MRKILVSMIVCMFAFQVYGVDSAKNACDSIKDSCMSAGYSIHGHKNNMKGLVEDCYHPILEGKNVGNISVKAEEIALCKNWIAKRKEKRLEVQSEAKEKRLDGNSIN